jgi:hypothetical protein
MSPQARQDADVDAACYLLGMKRIAVVVAVVSACNAGCPADPVRSSSVGNRGSSREGEGEGGDEGEGEGEAQCGANKSAPGAGAVYFGTREPSHVLLNAAQRAAIVGVGTGQPPGAECSGTLITDTVVLTATHCTEGIGANNFYVTFGVDDFNPDLVVDVVAKSEHPELDIAMLRLAEAPGATINVTPIAPFTGTLTSGDFGEILEQAGFGQTESGDSDGRYFVAELFDSFEEPGGYLVVNGEGRHGVCFGDSGGPSLRQTDSGVRVVGALSYGDPSCTEFDRYTRVDLSLDWIEDFAGEITDVPVGCGAVTAAGSCSSDGRSAQRCDNGVLVVDACAANEACDGGACAPNPCGDVTGFGACDGDVLRYCDDGAVVTRDCGQCGGDQVCSLVDNVAGFACIADPCGALTFQGECQGNVARWCENNTVQTVNCADDGSTCGFIDDETGFFCE